MRRFPKSNLYFTYFIPMKHQLLLCLLVFYSSLPGFAQSADCVSTYYPHINQAELAITRNDYASALSHYKP